MPYFLLIILSLVMIVATIFAIFTLFAIYSNAPYVPTHNHLVEKMLDLANVTDKDVVVDLGAGDGRIIGAAVLRGARTIGYEINPILVLVGNLRIWRLKSKFQNSNFKSMSNDQNPKNFLTLWLRILFDIGNLGFGFKNFGDRYPHIYWQNFWNVPLRNATVITIFGYPPMMGRLEKKLQKELKPGSRVVSHAFRFPNWQPILKEDGLLLYLVQ